MPLNAVSETSAYTIEDERFRSFVLGNASLEPLAHGRWFEGPVWFADQRVLLASDIPNDRIVRITEDGHTSVFRSPAGFPNGHTRDREGRLVGCSHGLRAVVRTELDGTAATLVDRFRGKRLNSPNDVVVAADGGVWFTDPTYGIETDYEGERQPAELPPCVYRLDPASGAIDCVADDFIGPNGLAFSPDGQRLYVTETGDQFAAEPKRCIRVFDVVAGGTRLSGGRAFHTVSPGYADGLRCDEDGHVWCGAGDGVHCLDETGALLGRIAVPSAVSNLCFGGRLRSRLFLCAGDTLYALDINRRGAQRP